MNTSLLRSIKTLASRNVGQFNTYSRCALIIPARRFHESTLSKKASLTPMRILFIGSPGAGKGTQASRLKQHFDVVTISSGDILRRNTARGTNIGKIAAKQMEGGGLVSDDVMIKIINNELVKLKQNSFILDGFPRTFKQATALDENLLMARQPLNLVVNIHVPEDVILKRIMDRWVHVPSGRVYNLSYNPPKRPGYDDVSGEKLTRRADDNPETFKVRLQKHHEITEPLLEYYAKRGILVTCAGLTSDEIYPQIESELTRRFPLHYAIVPPEDQISPTIPFGIKVAY